MPKEKKIKPLKLIDALKVVADEDISDVDTLKWLKDHPKLTEMKTFPTFTDGSKLTMLMWSSDKGKLKTAKFMLDKGADPDYFVVKDKKKWTAYNLAVEGGHENVANFLMKKDDVKEKEVIDLTDEPEKRLERASKIASMLYEKNMAPPKELEYEGAIDDFLDVHRPPRIDLLDSTQEDDESVVPASLPRSDSDDSFFIPETPPRDDSQDSMGSLKLSMSPALFPQLDEQAPSLMRKPKKSLATTLDAFYRRWS